jgi:Tfp pilus assembly protein PilF
MLLSIVLVSGMALASPGLRASESLAVQASEAASSAAQSHIDAGLAAFRRIRFHEAEKHFQAAVEADPQSAAATFYLAYTVYKIAEPKRPFHPDKQRAAQLFARAYELDPNFQPVWHHR